MAYHDVPHPRSGEFYGEGGVKGMEVMETTFQMRREYKLSLSYAMYFLPFMQFIEFPIYP